MHIGTSCIYQASIGLKLAPTAGAAKIFKFKP